MISTIKFKNYKIFKSWQTLQIKPMTVLIGKNSSGKSAVLKLPTLIQGSLAGDFPEPLRWKNNGIELGGEFKDLIYGRNPLGQLEFNLNSGEDELEVVVSHLEGIPKLFFWKYNDKEIIEPSEEDFNGFIYKQYSLNNLSLTTEYISSLRLGLERYFDKSPQKFNRVGLFGEHVYQILIDDALTTPQNLVKQVSEFYKLNFEGWGLSINKDTPPYVIDLESDDLRINIKDVGLGIVHALPLVTRACMKAEQKILISIEEPELHLHPAAHGNLAELFIESLTDTNKNYFIETHSQNFLLRLRALVAEGKLDSEDLAIYYVDYDEERNESNLVSITVNEQGEVDYWPENIFSESLYETIRIRKAQKQESIR